VLRIQRRRVSTCWSQSAICFISLAFGNLNNHRANYLTPQGARLNKSPVSADTEGFADQIEVECGSLGQRATIMKPLDHVARLNPSAY
jgi:hypothetical protein